MIQKDKKHTAIVMSFVVVAMICFTFAAVPLYRIFCQKTGYGGTPQVGFAPQGDIRNRMIRVQFNADVNPKLPWKFIPLQKEIRVRLGQQALAFYRAENYSDKPVVGMAVYNVAPYKAGIYFNKVECFCFIEQTLQPGESMDMPVQFFLDPDMDDDVNLDEVTTVTLSYTFYPLHK